MGNRVLEIEGIALRTVPAYHWVRMASHRDVPAGAGSRRAVRLCTQGCLQEEGGNKWCQTRTSTRVLRAAHRQSNSPAY